MTTFATALLCSVLFFWCGFGTKAFFDLSESKSKDSPLGWVMFIGGILHLILLFFIIFLILTGAEVAFTAK